MPKINGEQRIPFIIGYRQYVRLHPGTTYEWYVAYRKNKERRKGAR